MFSEIRTGLRQLFFPDNCFLCRRFIQSPAKQLCPSCQEAIHLNKPPFCLFCSRHLEHFTDAGLCQHCQGQGFAMDRLWSACLYEEPLVSLIHAFKYHQKTGLRHLFISLIIQFLETYSVSLHNVDVVVPVPLHPSRLRERGYNQAELLSVLLSAYIQKHHAPHLLRRSKPTPSQTTLSSKQRWTNMQGTFTIQSSQALTMLANQHVLLVDDLITTKATCHAAAKALKEAGAARVSVISLAIV